MTALEVTEGILNNPDAKNKSILFLREIICDKKNQEFISKLKKDGFYNKDENDERQLEHLKKHAKEKLQKINIMEYKVQSCQSINLNYLKFFFLLLRDTIDTIMILKLLKLIKII